MLSLEDQSDLKKLASLYFKQDIQIQLHKEALQSETLTVAEAQKILYAREIKEKKEFAAQSPQVQAVLSVFAESFISKIEV